MTEGVYMAEVQVCFTIITYQLQIELTYMSLFIIDLILCLILERPFLSSETVFTAVQE